jgi:hypothetical protein
VGQYRVSEPSNGPTLTYLRDRPFESADPLGVWNASLVGVGEERPPLGEADQGRPGPVLGLGISGRVATRRAGGLKDEDMYQFAASGLTTVLRTAGVALLLTACGAEPADQIFSVPAMPVSVFQPGAPETFTVGGVEVPREAAETFLVQYCTIGAEGILGGQGMPRDGGAVRERLFEAGRDICLSAANAEVMAVAMLVVPVSAASAQDVADDALTAICSAGSLGLPPPGQCS